MKKTKILLLKRLVFSSWIMFLLLYDIKDATLFSFLMRILLCVVLTFASKDHLIDRSG